MPSPAGPTRLLDDAVRKGWIGPDRARTVRIAGVPVLVLVVLAWLVIIVFRTGGAGPPAPDAEFIDASTGSYLDVQLDSSKEEYGRFAAVIGGQGRVWPEARVSASKGSGSTVELRYEGTGFRDPRIKPRTRDEPPRPLEQPEEVQLRLVGQVDPARHVASVDVWVDGDLHRITSAGAPDGAQAVVDDFLRAIQTGDWETLYTIQTSYMHNGTKRSEFPVAMANAGAITTLRSARATGPTIVSNRAGALVARTPIRLTYGTGRNATRVEAVLVCAVDGGAWGVLTLE